MPDFRIGSRPFAEQVAFFERKVSVPTAGWWDLQRGDHSHGFMVAGAFKADLLADLRGIVQAAIERGTPLEQFRKQFDAIVEKHGWVYKGGRNWRTRIIYETNIRQSFNAGRIAQLTSPTMARARPYWQYRHNDKGHSKNPRPLHQSWNGKVLRWNDPWWKTHTPMNGWGCKCGIRSLSEADLKDMGKTGPDQAPYDGTYLWTAPDGARHEIPAGIDPGFDYSPGAEARSLPSARRFGERVMQLPDAWRTRALEDAAKHARDWHADAQAAIGEMIESLGRSQGLVVAVGMLHPDAAGYLAQQGRLPATAMIGLADRQVSHLRRDSKLERGAALPEQILRTLPEFLSRPDVILFDRDDPALIYAWRQSDGRYAKVVIRLDFRLKNGEIKREPANFVQTAGLVMAGDLTGPRYERVRGEVMK